GLVEQEQLGPVRHGAGQHHAPSLALAHAVDSVTPLASERPEQVPRELTIPPGIKAAVQLEHLVDGRAEALGAPLCGVADPGAHGQRLAPWVTPERADAAGVRLEQPE